MDTGSGSISSSGRHYGSGMLLLIVMLYALCCTPTAAQRSPFSLQAAVDELHRREAANFPLNAPPSQQHYFGPLGSGGSDNDDEFDDYWDDNPNYLPAYNSRKNRRYRQRLNNALAKYLQRENYETEHGEFSLEPFGGYGFDDEQQQSSNRNLLFPASERSAEQKKRSSFFRERDYKFDEPSEPAFRSRDADTYGSDGADHAVLAEQFLREIEESKQRDKEDHYKDALRNLWEKYQTQENEVDSNTFEEKKRMRTPPYYMLMQKKRSYPVLPWLPYSAERKKRFPVAKRSTGASYGSTDDKVAKELKELFGNSLEEEKKKRSTNEQPTNANSLGTTFAPPVDTVLTTSEPLKKSTTTLASTTHSTQSPTVVGEQPQKSTAIHAVHSLLEHRHRKRSDDRHHEHSHESHESEEESEEHEEDEHDEHEEEEEDEHEEQEEERKKKREVSQLQPPSAATAVNSPKNILNNRHKKSIDWSKYFGLDRKRKRASAVNDESSQNTNGDADAKKKRNIDPEKLENMDKKLQSIEDFIIDETIKYTGAHEGIHNSNEIRQLKDHVLSRLATAYSLEKMRRALEKLRQSVDNENHLLRNVIEPQLSEDDDRLKRLTLTKEKDAAAANDDVLPNTNDKTKEIHSNAMMSTSSSKGAHSDNDSNESDEDLNKKKKKKRGGYMRYPEISNDLRVSADILNRGRFEPLNDAYLGTKNYIMDSNQCPIIESMANRCRGVDLLSGDINQELLPICGVHQVCYLCGVSKISCDYQYLAEADQICGNNNDCQAAARSVLMILRGTPGTQLGPRECLKNPCLYSAMREIGL